MSKTIAQVLGKMKSIVSAVLYDMIQREVVGF